MGVPEDAQWLRSKLRLPFVCLSDPQQQAYRAYEIPRGDALQVSGPAVWGAGLRATLRGGIGIPKGDLRQLHGTAVIDPGGTLRYLHRPKNSADQPSTDEILQVLEQIDASREPPEGEPGAT
jgi:peroxiredoxin